jgi:hypothetical protein
MRQKTWPALYSRYGPRVGSRLISIELIDEEKVDGPVCLKDQFLLDDQPVNTHEHIFREYDPWRVASDQAALRWNELWSSEWVMSKLLLK